MDNLQLQWQGLTLAGSIELPDQAGDAVLMLHGFTGNRMEYTYLFVDLARRLAREQIATCRFDFPGCGESEGDFSAITVAQQIAVAGFLLDTLRQRYPALRWHLFGFSMGGLGALHTAKNLPQPPVSLCVLAPALNLAQVVEQNCAQGRAMPDGRCDLLGLPVGQALRRELAKLDPLAGLAQLATPTLILHGTHDAAVPEAVSQALPAMIPGARRQLIDGADHVLGQLGHRIKVAGLLQQWLASSWQARL